MEFVQETEMGPKTDAKWLHTVEKRIFAVERKLDSKKELVKETGMGLVEDLTRPLLQSDSGGVLHPKSALWPPCRQEWRQGWS